MNNISTISQSNSLEPKIARQPNQSSIDRVVQDVSRLQSTLCSLMRIDC